MENYTYQEINKELKEIRETRKILEDRLDKLKHPVLLVKSIFLDFGPVRRKSLIEKVIGKDGFLAKRYSALREKYENRFENFKSQEQLFSVYEQINDRITDLEKRYKRVDNFRGILLPSRKKQLKKTLNGISEEIHRRKRAIKDLYQEFENRGLNVEDYYWAKSMERFNKTYSN